MSKKSGIGLLALILIIATFFRVYQIAQIPPGLYPDEAMDGNSGLQALANTDLLGQNTPSSGASNQGPTFGFKVFYPENNGREGLYANLDALIFAVLEPSEPSPTAEGVPWVLRLPSVIAGILTVLALYFLAKELFSKEVGLLASFLLAVSFWHINFSRIGFRAILAPFFLTWALFYLIRAFKNDSSSELLSSESWEDENSPTKGWSTFGGKSWKFALAGGIMYGLGFYTYIAYRVSPLLLLLCIPYFRKEKKFWKNTFIFLIATFIVALPIGLYFLHNPADFTGRTSEISIFRGPSPLTTFIKNTGQTLAMFNYRGDGNERHNYMGQPELEFLVGIFFVVGTLLAFAGALIPKKEKSNSEFQNIVAWYAHGRFPYLLLLSWFVLAILPVAISNEGIPHALRAIMMIPPVMIFAALGGMWTYSFLGKWMGTDSRKFASLLVLAVLMFQAYITYFVLWANSESTRGAFAANYVTIGEKINALPAGHPKYVIVQAGGVPIPITLPSGKVKEIPVPAQTVMFITDTYFAAGQKAKNVHYLLPDEISQIPESTSPDQIFTIE